MNDPWLVDALLWAVVVSTSICVGTLVARRLYRIVPAFTMLLLFDLLTAGLVILISRGNGYWDIYLVSSIAEYVLQVAVMWEIIRLVVALVKAEVTSGNRTFAACILFFCLIISATLAILSHFYDAEREVEILLRWDIAFDIFRVLFMVSFLLVAKILGIRWDHVSMRIASALSIYSSIALGTRAIQQFAATLPKELTWFLVADRASVLSWTVSMLVLSWQFAHYRWVEPASHTCPQSPSQISSYSTEEILR